jgi:hypothetical protein
MSSITTVTRSSHKKQRKSRGKGKDSSSTTWSVLSQGMPHMQMKYPDNGVFRFFSMERKGAAMTNNNATITQTNFAFTSADISQFTSFATVFDQYRITRVEAWIVPVNPQSSNGAAVSRGSLLTVIDYDDTTNLGSEAAAEAYENCVITPASVGQYRSFVPHIAVASYGGTFTQFTNLLPSWIDCASTAVQHYGLKTIVTITDAAADSVTFDVYIRLHYEFRNVR